MGDFKDTVQKQAVSAEDIKRAIAKGPDYCSTKLQEFLHHASVLMQSMQSLYLEDAAALALVGVHVHCSVTVQSPLTGKREEIAVFGIGTEKEEANEPVKG